MTPVSLTFQMPDGILEILASYVPEDRDVDLEEEINDLFYYVRWKGVLFPYHFSKKINAIAFAFGCQNGAYELQRRIFSLNHFKINPSPDLSEKDLNE